MTSQRRAILEELRQDRTHPTAEQVFQRVRTRVPTVSLGTVYRNLEFMVKWGLVRVIRDQTARMRFDGTEEEHFHIRCERCGRLEDVPMDAGASLVRAVGQKTGYRLSGASQVLHGLCPQCRKEMDRKGQSGPGAESGPELRRKRNERQGH